MKRHAVALVLALAATPAAQAGQNFTCGQLIFFAGGMAQSPFHSCRFPFVRAESDTTRRFETTCWNHGGGRVKLVLDFPPNGGPGCRGGYHRTGPTPIGGSPVLDDPIELPAPSEEDSEYGDGGGGGGEGPAEPLPVPATGDDYPILSDGYPMPVHEYLGLPPPENPPPSDELPVPGNLPGVEDEP